MKRISVVIGALLVGITVLLALTSVFWTPHPPTGVNHAQLLLPPSVSHPLGTDGFGIDILSQIMVGARLALLVSLLSVMVAAGIGVPLGVWSAMRGGWVSAIINRGIDILYAFPAVLLAILLAAAFGGSTLTGTLAIGIATIPVFTRIARAGTLQVMSQDFILAARASGIRPLSIARRHIWPNISALIGVQITVSLGMSLLAQAALSYLGLSTPPTTPTWGRLIYDAQKHLFTDPQLVLWPALAIAISVLGFNVLGDSLRDYLDPKLRELK